MASINHDDDKIKECTSVISSVRALPSQVENPIHNEYYSTRGVIVNNEYDMTTGTYVVPGSTFGNTYSLTVPKSKDPDCSQGVCNDLSPSPYCPEKICPNQVSLPSLVFLVQNNVECSLNTVSIEDAFCSLADPELTKLCLPKGCNVKSKCYVPPNPAPTGDCSWAPVCENGTLETRSFLSNGILAAVYQMFRYRGYGYWRREKDINEFIIRPYTLSRKPSIGSPCSKLETSDCSALTENEYPRMGSTFPFCIGKKYSCAYINLLLHGGMKRGGSETPSVSDDCIVSDLHWVSVKIYFKKNGKPCSKNPDTVHIEKNQNEPLYNCFNVCFATTRPVVTGFTNPGGYPYNTPDHCPPDFQCFDPSMPPQNMNPCTDQGIDCNILDVVWVSDCIDFDEFDSYNGCKIYIVLLPVTKQCSLLE